MKSDGVVALHVLLFSMMSGMKFQNLHTFEMLEQS